MNSQHIQKLGVKSLAEILVVDKGVTDKNLDGEKDVSMSEGTSLNEQTVQNMCFPGIEFKPAKGEKLVIIPINGSDSYMVSIGGVNENITPDCADGERRIFATNAEGTELKAFAKFKNTGIIELNGNDNHAVLFNELKTEFNELKNKYNDLKNKYNAHIHVTTATIGLSPVGAISPVTPLEQGSASGANIDNTKSENVLLKSN